MRMLCALLSPGPLGRPHGTAVSHVPDNAVLSYLQVPTPAPATAASGESGRCGDSSSMLCGPCLKPQYCQHPAAVNHLHLRSGVFSLLAPLQSADAFMPALSFAVSLWWLVARRGGQYNR
jgi:hypothetical protein